MSSVMIRSAINAAASVAARQGRNIKVSKASMSTISYYHPSSFEDDRCDTAAADALPTINTSDSVSSLLSSMMANLTGTPALVTMDQIARQLEEGLWEDVSTAIIELEEEDSPLGGLSLWQISTLKRRKKMMNKHKLRKRRKKMRLKKRK